MQNRNVPMFVHSNFQMLILTPLWAGRRTVIRHNHAFVWAVTWNLVNDVYIMTYL